MSKKPIWVISLICGLVYMVFPFLIILIVYIIGVYNFIVPAIFLGIVCGTAIALVTYSGELRRTTIARITGILSVVAAELLLELLGVPNRIILYIYRNSEWVQYSGRLSVNETIGYGWSMMFFWGAMLISFFVVCIGTFVYGKMKKQRIEKQITLNEIGQ